MEKFVSPWELNYLQRQQHINNWASRAYQPRLRVVDKILVYHPDEHRRYLRQHPCTGCQAEGFCDHPCPVYLQWYNARMEAVRIRGRERTQGSEEKEE